MRKKVGALKEKASYSVWFMQEIMRYWEINFGHTVLDVVVQPFFSSPQNKRCIKLKLITRWHYFSVQHLLSIPLTHSLGTPRPPALSQCAACAQDSRQGTLSLHRSCRNPSLRTHLALCGGKSLDEPLSSRATHFNLGLPRTCSP